MEDLPTAAPQRTRPRRCHRVLVLLTLAFALLGATSASASQAPLFPDLPSSSALGSARPSAPSSALATPRSNARDASPAPCRRPVEVTSYDPCIRLFLQLDPSGYENSPNLYAGFGNDPINNRDPTGRAFPAVIALCLANPACRVAVGAGAGAVIGAGADIVHQIAEQIDNPGQEFSADRVAVAAGAGAGLGAAIAINPALGPPILAANASLSTVSAIDNFRRGKVATAVVDVGGAALAGWGSRTLARNLSELNSAPVNPELGKPPQMAGLGSSEEIASQLLEGSGGSVSKALPQLGDLRLGQDRAIEVLNRMYEATGRGTGGAQSLPDGAKVVLSRRVGPNQAVLIVKPDGSVMEGNATIEITGDVSIPLRATDIKY